MSDVSCNTNKIDVYVELAGKERFHNSLMGRMEDDQHPISAITNLQDKLDELAALNNSYTKEEIDAKIEGSLVYKGSVSDFESLPVIENKIGDVYNVCSTGNNYVWTGNSWDNLSGTGTEHSDWATKDYVDGSVNNAVNIITSHMGVHYYNKEEIDQMLIGQAPGSNLLSYRGDVAKFDELPLDAKIGDLYYIEDVKKQYFWDGFDWQIVGIDTYSKEEIDAKLSAIFTYKGSVKTKEELPQDANIGDTYNVELDGANYAWNGTEWDKLSETIDLTGFVKEEDLKDFVKYSHFTTDGQDRKAIQLNNYDSISGIATDGTGHNIAMVSKFDVVDFASPKLHTNINTSKIVTVNDTQAVLTDELLQMILVSGRNIIIEKNQVTDPATGFKFYQYNLSVDLDGLVDENKLNEALATKQDVGNYVEVAEDGSTKIGNAIIVNPDNTIIIKNGDEDIVLQEALSNTVNDDTINKINERLATLEDIKADKADFYTKQEIDEKDKNNIKWTLFTDSEGKEQKRAFIGEDLIITDKLLENSILPGDNVVIKKNTSIDSLTSFPTNSYEVSVDLTNYYDKGQIDDIHEELKASIDAVEANAEQWLSMSDVINSTK